MQVKDKTILVGGDSAVVPTGYGGVKAKILPYLHNKLGMKVSEVGIQTMGNPHLAAEGYERLPNHRSVPFAAESMTEWMQERHPDLVWYLGDPHWFHWLANINRQLTEKDAKWYKSIVYFPIDTDVIPKSFVQTIQSNDAKVTFTEYAKSVCNNHGIDDVQVVYHGVDTDIFKPLPEAERSRIRSMNNLSDKFIVGQINRNNFRKQTPLLMSAFAKFAKDKPDAVLFLHCDPKDQQGFDLPEYVEQLGLNGKIIFNQKVKNAITGVPPEELNLYYNIMDVHASATTGEGWGLTTTEAQAAGCPVIIGDHTTGPELVKNNGWLVDLIKPREDALIYTQQGGHYYRIAEGSMVNAMNEAYADRTKTRQKGAAASKYIRGHYSWDRVLRGWDKVFDSL